MDSTNTNITTSDNNNPCPICLGPFVQESYMDSCFHKFCFNCIIRWTKVVANKQSQRPSLVECPLCKTENFSIIYDYDGSSFQRHYFNRNCENSSFFSKEHKYRLQCYYTEPGLLNKNFDVMRYWKAHKYVQPNRWLQSWLRREIQALMQVEDVDILVHHLLGVIGSFSRRSERFHQAKAPETIQQEFKDSVSESVRPFIAARTNRFVDELELFLSSGLNIEAYDEVYKQKLGLNRIPSETNEATDTTATVQYLYIFDEDSDEAN